MFKYHLSKILYLFIDILLEKFNFNGDWGLGIGDWGLGIGDWAR